MGHFEENTADNASMAKSRSRPRCKNMARPLTPEMLVQRLQGVGVHVSRKTLRRWEAAGVISEAARGSYGQGHGKYCHYPEAAFCEAAAAYLMREVNEEGISAISRSRKNGLAGLPTLAGLRWNRFVSLFEDGLTFREAAEEAERLQSLPMRELLETLDPRTIWEEG